MTRLNPRAMESEAKLERRVEALERQIQQIPSRWALPFASYDLGYIGGGNNISPAGYIGIKKIATVLATVPTAYDPTIFPSTVDGIGYGWHFRLGAWVLMLNDSRSGIAHDIPNNAPVFISPAPVQLDLVFAYVIILV